jgi:hypothetical protein
MDEPNAILSGFWGQCERLQMDHDLFSALFMRRARTDRLVSTGRTYSF